MQFFINSIRPLLGTSLIVAAAGLLLCLVLGGATRAGFLSDTVLQLLSIPLLMITLIRWGEYGTTDPSPAGVRFGLFLCGLIVLLPAIQLVPLPVNVWMALGGRDALAESYSLIGEPLPWRPLSVVPHATWLALLSFIPAITVFLATLQVGWGGRRILSLVVIVFGAFSVCFGLLQVAQGPESPLRLYAVTNIHDAVGLFANRNHYAALLYCVLALALAWTIAATGELASNSDKGLPTHLLVPALLGVAMVSMLMVAQSAARSRAGIGLTILLLVFAAVLPQGKKARALPASARRISIGRYSLVSILVVFLITGSSSLQRVLDRFDVDPMKDSRIPFGRNTIEAAIAHMPFGSGIGSFPPVYAVYEKAADVSIAYANRAHNDILEAWLETGVPGIVVFGLFIVWLMGRACNLLRRGRAPGMEGLDHLLATAAFAAIVLLIVHSVVDYPLRTAAMSGLLAFLCALLLPPPPLAIAREACEEIEPRSKRQRSTRREQVMATGIAQPVLSPETAAPIAMKGTGAAKFDPASPPDLPAANWQFPKGLSIPVPPPMPPAVTEAPVLRPTAPTGDGSKASGWGEGVVWPDEWRGHPTTPPPKDKPGDGSR